jgi:acetoin utilization protein AcuB
MLRARDLMTENPVVVRATATLGEAARMLQAQDIRHLPVVNADDELVGMLSDRDLRALMIPVLVDDEWIGNIRSTLDTRVANVMSGGVLSVTLDADAAEIVDLMLDHSIGAVPVVDADGRLAGIVSYVDLLRELSFEAAAS